MYEIIKEANQPNGSVNTMLALSFTMLMFMTMVSSLNFKSISSISEIKNIASFVLILGNICMGSIFCFALVDYQEFITSVSELSKDYRMYACIILEYIGLIALRTNYKANGNNVTAINFSLFFSLSIVPILAFYLNEPLGFENTMQINYKSSNEFLAFTSGLTVLVLLYFVDKIKGHIAHWGHLLFTPVIMSVNIFLTAKMMQDNNPYVVSIIICMTNLIIISLSLINSNEFKELKQEHKKPLLKVFAGGNFVYPLNAVVVQLIAVEFITILKRIAQIITGVITDKIYKNENTVNKKDIIIIILIFIIGVTMYYLRS